MAECKCPLKIIIIINLKSIFKAFASPNRMKMIRGGSTMMSVKCGSATFLVVNAARDTEEVRKPILK